MALVTPTYLFFIFLFIVAAAIGGIIANEKHKRETDNCDFQILPFVEDMLKLLNCQYHHELKDKWHEYTFKFQNGNFIIICREGDSNVRIHYPQFFNANIEYLDIIREICNICNAHGFSHHVVYTTSGKDNVVTLHITSSISVIDNNKKYEKIFRDNLAQIFSIAQEFYLRFDKAKEQTKEQTPYDVEKEYLKYEREFFMLKEMEICHLKSKKIGRSSANSPLTIAQILQQIYSWQNPDLLELKVITQELHTIVGDREISDFDISKVLISFDADQSPVFIGTNATLILTFIPPMQTSLDFPEQLIITLHNEGRTSDVLYQRATLIYSPTTAHAHYKTPKFEQNNENVNISFVFAYDRLTPNHNVKEAIQCIRELERNKERNDAEDLPEETKFLDRTLHPSIWEICNYGVNLFRQKRYYETIAELEYVYNYLSTRFQEFTQKDQDLFYELCYYIGFSYCELGLCKRAYYYLDAIFPLNNLTYMQTYVNCLVNAKDFRALSVIDNIISAVQSQNGASGENVPDNVRRFVNFLQRRKAHHYVDMGEYDKARKIYEVLYLDPESQDYALNELAYLQGISKKEKNNNNQSDNNQ